MVVAILNQFLTGRANVTTTISVSGEICLEGIMFLQQALYCGHGVTIVLHSQQLLLLTVSKSYICDYQHNYIYGNSQERRGFLRV
jgi:hypothetical protein